MDEKEPNYLREILPLWKNVFTFFIPLPTWGQAVTLLLLAILPIVFIFWVGENSEGFVNNVVNESTRWWFAALWASLLLFPTFVMANIDLYKKQKSIQKELKAKLESPVVHEGLGVYPHNGLHNPRVGITIFNSTGNNTSNLKVELKSLTFITYRNNYPNYTLLPYIEFNNRSFHKGDRLNTANGIDKLDYVFMYLAEVRNNELFFLLDNPFQFQNYEVMKEGEKSLNAAKEIQPLYTGYSNITAHFEIELEITVENGQQLIVIPYKGLIQFLEMIRQWVRIGEKWESVGDKPIVEIQLDIE